MTSMKRRAFVAGLGALLAAPLHGEAQQARRLWRIGILSLRMTSDLVGPQPSSPAIGALFNGLRDSATWNIHI